MSLAGSIAKTTTDILKSKKFLGVVVVAGIGLVATTAVTGTVVAKKHIDEAQADKDAKAEQETPEGEPLPDTTLTKVEVVKACWKDYVPCAAACAITVTAFAHLYSRFSKENAALHGLLSVSEATVESLQKKMISQIGEKKALPVISEAKQEVMEKEKPKEVKTNAISTDMHGDEILNLCDPWSMRTFRTTKFAVQQALENVNLKLHDGDDVYLNDFYEWLDLEDSEAGNLVGWRFNRMNEYKLEVIWGGLAGAYVDNEGKAWTYIQFNVGPNVL